jgi:hypothetical protein
MAFKYEDSGSKEFERPDVGQKAGRCLMAIEMGTVKNDFPDAKYPTKPEILLVFELNQLMEDGRPFVVSEKMTFSFGDNAHMMRHLIPWRGGNKYTEDEKRGFDLGKLVGKAALVQIYESPDKHKPEKIWTNIKQIAALPDEMESNVLQNVPVYFEIEEIGTDKWELIYPWVQKMIIEKSEEGQAYLAAHPGFEYGKKKSQEDPKQQEDAKADTPAPKDDEIPF